MTTRETQVNIASETNKGEQGFIIERGFMIERLCPELAKQQCERLPQLRDLKFPMLVQVDPTPVPNINMGCSARILYRVDEKRARAIRKQNRIMGAGPRYVCEHMGRLV